MCVCMCRKKAISRSGGIPALVAVLSGSCAEGSMHAAQGLLHMAKLPDLKVHVMIVLPQCAQNHDVK